MGDIFVETFLKGDKDQLLVLPEVGCPIENRSTGLLTGHRELSALSDLSRVGPGP